MLPIKSIAKSSTCLTAATFALFTGALTTHAVAQGTESGSEADGVRDVVTVTGSRIKRDGFNSPTPVTVIGNELVDALAQSNVSETIKLIPQNYSSQSDASAGYGTSSNVGSTFANLRGFNGGGTRTLTLVNTRRFIPSSDGGSVDLNMIPSTLIARVETVTGGASAAYGSDAVAGVVNVILDTDFTGFKAEIDYGQTIRNDGRNYHGAVAWGTDFADGRGHLILSGEYQDQKGIGDCSTERNWCAESWDIFTNAQTINPAGGISGYDVPGSPGYGLPNFILGPDSKIAFNHNNGVVRDRGPAPAAARNFTFTDDGADIVPFDPGNFISTTTFRNRQGGDGPSTYSDSDLRTPVERKIAYLYSSYELSDKWKIDGEFTFARRNASSIANTTGPRSTFFVKATNPFVPDSLEALLGGASFSINKDLDPFIVNENSAKATTLRGAVGIQGEIFEYWNFNAYYQYGRNKRDQLATRSRVNTPFIYALDAVIDPSSGDIVCAETLEADPDPVSIGCVPMNLFGITNLTEGAIDYVYRPVTEDFVFSQHVLAFDISGTLFEYGAGSFDVAFGADYRKESGNVTHGDIPNYNDYAFTFGRDYGGKISVFETFFEANAPIVSDQPFAQLIELNGAVRYTRNHSTDTVRDLSKSIDAISWKVGGIYDVIDGLRIRATRSRDIRAAGFRELFLNNVPTESGSAQGRVDNPNIAGSPAGGDDDTPILGGGSFALGAEKSDTTTAGIVLTPSFIPGLQVSADWYQIEIRDAVAGLSGQGIVDACFDDGVFCDRITFASPTDITFVEATLINLGQFEARGIDFETSYTFPALGGDVSLRALGTYQYDFIVRSRPDAMGTDYAGQSGQARDTGGFTAAPKWIWNAFVTYSLDRFSTTVHMNRVGKGLLNVDYIGPDNPAYDPSLENSINDNTVDSATYFTLSLSYRMPLKGADDGEMELFAVANNLFDKDPAIAPGDGSLNQGSFYPTNPTYFDTFGARFKVGARVRF